MTIGAASHLLQSLSAPVRTGIAAQFGIRSDALFINWAQCLFELRNMCARHDRLFNRSFQRQPQRLKSLLRRFRLHRAIISRLYWSAWIL